jgi:hypothetical protein
MAALRALFSPPIEALPKVEVQMADRSSCDRLVGTVSSVEVTE